MLKCPCIAAGLGAVQHALGLGDQLLRGRSPQIGFCLVTLVHRFLSLHDRDRCRGERAHGQDHQAGDGGAVRVKPCRGFVPGEAPAGQDKQELIRPAPLQPVGDFLVGPCRGDRVGDSTAIM